MWRSNAERLPADPEDGMEVSVFGQLTIYEGGGRYQMAVETLEARGEGLWQLAFEKLKRLLAAEGLLDPARKRALPRVPLRVGIVTSRSGAALRDVAAVVRRRAPWTHILLADCRVQGEGASGEIVRALDRLVREGSSEVIILTRGGGSIEDLWAFNEEAVARAIAACPIPTISAVGHEIDFTIADLVADYRAPTPSAAGEAVVPEREALLASLQSLGMALAAGLRDRTRRGGERLERSGRRLLELARRSLETRATRRDGVAGRLHALSPLGVLQRGYAVPLDAENRVLRRVTDFEVGEAFRLRVADGEVEAVTRSTKSHGSE
jgi:exodeoxyribonuclease VII large subunit